MMYKIPEDKHYQLHYRTHASINIYIYIFTFSTNYPDNPNTITFIDQRADICS